MTHLVRNQTMIGNMTHMGNRIFPIMFTSGYAPAVTHDQKRIQGIEISTHNRLSILKRYYSVP